MEMTIVTCNFTFVLISNNFSNFTPSISVKITMNLIENSIDDDRFKAWAYFSKPLSARKRCVSVIDIFSKALPESGVGSDALSIRN